MNMKDFFEGLSPEQMERFKTCEDNASIVAFAKEEKLALPEEFLDRIAGGASSTDQSVFIEGVTVCPGCGCTDVSHFRLADPEGAVCDICGEYFYPWS